MQSSNKFTTRSGTDLLFSSQGLSKYLLWARYVVDWARRCMLMDFWLTTFLIFLHKEGGNWSIVVWHHVHTPNIKASLPDDWFRQLITPQANAKIIYLLWGVCVCVWGWWDSTSKQRHMGGAYVIIGHMLNGKLWKRMDDLSCTSSRDYSCINSKCWISLRSRQHSADWWSTML